MNKIAFVILNYCTFDDTIDCVNSIKKRIDTRSYAIIVVDNDSPDNSGQRLSEIFGQDEKVTVLQNTENIGFAKGNNVGFIHAKNKFQSKFIVLLNSDTYLIQDDFFDVIQSEYTQSNFAVLGPQIITPDKNTDNPYPGITTLKQANALIWKLKIHLFFNYVGIESLCNAVLCKIKNVLNIKQKSNVYINERCENVTLHGCCMVFSPIYIKNFNGLDSRTFLYGEEDILYAQIMKNNLKTVYNPLLKIYHKEDASTNAMMEKKSVQWRFKYKHHLKSLEVLRNMLN